MPTDCGEGLIAVGLGIEKLRAANDELEAEVRALREALVTIRDMEVSHHDPGLTTQAHMKSAAFLKMKAIARRALAAEDAPAPAGGA